MGGGQTLYVTHIPLGSKKKPADKSRIKRSDQKTALRDTPGTGVMRCRRGVPLRGERRAGERTKEDGNNRFQNDYQPF